MSEPIYQPDESLDQPTRIELCGRELELANLQGAKVGDLFKVSSLARIVSVEMEEGENGLPSECVTLELRQLRLEQQGAPEGSPASMYPSMK